MAAQLKPCPFCGGHAEIDEQREYANFFTGIRESAISASCHGECDAEIMICRADVPGITPEEVAAMWNRRTPAIPADSKGGERAESLHVRVSPSQREKVARNGGGQWVRALIDAAHEKNS